MKQQVTYNKEIESWEDINLVKASLYEYIKERLEKDGRKSIRANYDSKSIKKAKLVFTGSIEAKKNEFLFFPSGNKKDVDVSVYEAFEKVYFLNEDSIDGQFWKKQFSISCPPPCQIKIAPPPRSEVDLLFKKVQFLMI